MNDKTTNIICELASWEWSSIIQSATGIVLVCIAYTGLTSWKRQHKSQKVTDLLDELTDAIHDLVQSISIPLQRLKFIHIAIESYQFNPDLNKELAYPEAMSFIEKEGREVAAELMESLTPCANTVHKIRSLVVKGQVFDIKDFNECQNACNLITWQYDRLQVIYAILSGQNMNWKHPEVIKHVGNLLDITSEDIEKYLKENQVEFLKFVKKAYAREYKNA